MADGVFCEPDMNIRSGHVICELSTTHVCFACTCPSEGAGVGGQARTRPGAMLLEPREGQGSGQG